jgi:hypothetical protein
LSGSGVKCAENQYQLTKYQQPEINCHMSASYLFFGNSSNCF